MAWRPAYSLETLKAQLDATYPGWLFLGFLGDQAHASVPSDHNPNAEGVVCALDIGPGGGLDIHALADNIASNPQPDLKYIISNRRIAEWQYDFQWREYTGSDPHDTHIHVSVGRGPDGQSRQPYDDRNNWNIEGDEMLDAAHQSALFAAFLGRLPTPAEVQRDVGKITVDTMINNLDSSSEYADKKKRDQQAYDALNNQSKQFKPYTGPQLGTLG